MSAARTSRRALAVLVMVAPALVPVGASGQEGFASTGGTTVVVDAPIVTITTTIDLVVGDPDAEGVAEWANGIALQIMDFWNDGLLPVSDCALFNLVVTITPVGKAAVREIPVNGGTTLVTVPGHHVVAWEGTDPNAPWPETFDPHDADHVANPGEDYTTPYEHELWAVWSGHLDTPAKFAHEFGHLLGFGDDDRRSGLPLSGRQGTLMDGGDRIDEALAQRLADLARHADEKVPKCEEWTGTYSGTITFDCNVLGVKQGTMEGQFSIAVDATGVATMEGTNTTTASCGPDATATTPLTLTGTRTPTGFEFPSLWGLPLTITVTGDRGTGAITEAGPGLGITTLTADIAFQVERSDPAAE